MLTVTGFPMVRALSTNSLVEARSSHDSSTNKIKVSSSLHKNIKQYLRMARNKYKQMLSGGHSACAEPRGTRQSTWITKDIVSAYEELNRIGYAHSIEVWRKTNLLEVYISFYR